MSSVWLTASAVRYMICKLLRARASQGFSAASVAGVNSALPSCCESDWTMRDLAEPGGTAHDVHALADVLRPAVAGAGEQHHRAAELHLIAAGEFFLLDPLVIDKRAVGAAQIDEQKVLAQPANFGVAAGDFGIVQLNPIARHRDQDRVLTLGRPIRSEPLDPDPE